MESGRSPYGASGPSRPEMNRSPAKKRLEWSEIGVFAVLGGLIVCGLAANGLSAVQIVVSLGCGAGVLAVAWLWQVTVRQAEAEPSEDDAPAERQLDKAKDEP